MKRKKTFITQVKYTKYINQYSKQVNTGFVPSYVQVSSDVCVCVCVCMHNQGMMFEVLPGLSRVVLLENANLNVYA